MKFTVIYDNVCPGVDIDTETIKDKESFTYSNILGMYKTKSTQGHGIQVNDTSKEKLLLKMCDKIAQAVYDYQKEIN